MGETEAADRDELHGLIGTALANLIGAPDEKRHLTDTLAFLADRLNQMAVVTQVRILQMQMDLAASDLATLQKINQPNN
ncbi:MULTISPECIES: hypothetical protein [Rhodopseudomonas]|uniref:Uncharacterized protein n=1 Tax=Rhodopseudomonas palustris TaxID=1076 RepID=A0A0D7EC23_RHOPL|nr:MULTISPECIES: hypothetical protein [Rhodopseudomonas]KIZ38065.1 hypothetical protein OO17_23135 [Rhodopseudomonas palustris]MDF3810542.1 hypothetical protein [Rhodopseudomonas sp. BAL398]WOK18398.1 hypothetical protein RBJ75_02375 [Rhodopseudomonas sp. BAL398]